MALPAVGDHFGGRCVSHLGSEMSLRVFPHSERTNGLDNLLYKCTVMWQSPLRSVDRHGPPSAFEPVEISPEVSWVWCYFQ